MLTRYSWILLFIFFITLLFISATYTFIGRGDYANYSNVARNLVRGNGFSVDYIAFHYIQYDSIRHPEDMWPILQPVWIAGSYLLLGITPFASRVPNAIFFTILVGLTYFVGTKLFNKWVGFWAALLTALNPALITYSTVWITSDLALALFSLIIFYIGFECIKDALSYKLSTKKLLLLGIFSGLAVLQKPMGILLPVIYFLYLAFLYRRNLSRFVFPGMVYFLSTFLIVLPFFIRNYLLFGSLLLPIEHYLGYLVKYFHYEHIFSIYYNNLPSFQTWLDYGWQNFLKVNFQYFRYSIDTFVYKDLLMPYTVIVLSILGITKLDKEKSHFFKPLIILFVVMSVLMATYWHYESRYYSMLIPIFNMLAVYFLTTVFNKLDRKTFVILAVIGFITFLPSLKALNEGLKQKEDDPALSAYHWIAQNTPPDAVIMTLTPWELNFHSDRLAITIPYEERDEILWLAKKYKVDYLELEFLNEIKRGALKELYEGKSTPEFDLVYDDRDRIYIYKINWENISLDPGTAPSWY